MRYELTDEEWAAIKPMLPNKPRGVPRASSGSCDLERHGAIGRSSVHDLQQPLPFPGDERACGPEL